MMKPAGGKEVTRLPQLPLRVLIRADAGADIGSGHIMRCLALAEGFNFAGAQCLFLVNSEAAKVLRQQSTTVSKFEIVEIDKSDAVEDDLGTTPVRTKISKSETGELMCWKPDLVVLDGYHFSPDYRKRLSSFSQLLVLDDNNDTGPLYADFVLNTSPASGQLNYPHTAPGALLLLGTEYCLLRPEFEAALSDNLLSKRETLLLTFGGSDPLSLSIIVLERLHHYFSKDTPVVLITGAAFSGLAKVESLMKKSPLEIRHHHAVKNMVPLMRAAKLAVSAAGSTQYELAACGVPAILAIVAENQQLASEKAESGGFCRIVNFIGKETTQAVDQLLDTASQCWSDQRLLSSMSERLKFLVPGGGAEKVAQKVLENIRAELTK